MATEGGSLGNLVQVYKFVVEDVIKNVKEDFLNEGVEPEVLDQLQELWLRKEDLTDAVNRPRKPQLDPHPTPAPPPPSHLPPEQSSRLPPALIHQPLSSSTAPHPSTGPQSQVPQESVIQLAPPRIPQTTPTLPTPTDTGTTQPSQPASSPSLHHLQLLSQAGYQVAMSLPGASPMATAERTESSGSTASGSDASQTTPSTSQLQAAAAQLSRLAGVAAGVSGVTPGVGVGTPTGLSGLMPQLVVNPSVGGLAALQNQPVLVPVQTSQGTVMVPLSMLAMQHAMASQQNQSNSKSGSDETTANQVQQIDGFPPEVSATVETPHASQSPPLLPSDGASGVSTETEKRHNSDKKLFTPHGSRDQTHTEELELEGCSSIGDIPVRTSDTCFESGPSSAACKKKFVPKGAPSGFLAKLLRQQRRRKKRGEVGGVPVEVIVQLDGPNGGGGKGGGKGARGGEEEGGASSSDDESDGYGDSSDEEEVDQVEPDDDPLGSGDDEADSETEDKDFDTEDTVACQWEKVYRVKTKWKFQLKDGIMRMGGFEYVFHKANGEAEW